MKSQIEDEFLNLLDKYLKESNNFLPLQAYLQFLETGKLESFSHVCKFNSNSSSNEIIGIVNNANKLNNVYTLSSSLNLVKSQTDLIHSDHSNKCHSELILLQKLYKIIISIDYSPQTSSLGFIKKSLEKIFDKLTIEFNEFFNNCSKTEPHIYVTVLLWNVSYLQMNNTNFQKFFGDFSNENNGTNQIRIPVPFTILCHSKRLVKSNISELSSFIFEKVNESRLLFLEPVKFNFGTNINSSPIIDQENTYLNFKINNNKIISNDSPFDELINTIIKIFDFFGLNEFPTQNSLAFSHHIHITDGLIYAGDMIRSIERISKSSITLSFIYSGSKNLSSGSNISSGFGFLADHYFMKFLSNITNGFYSVIDENMDLSFISSKKLLIYFNLSSFLSNYIFFDDNIYNNRSNAKILSSEDEHEEVRDSFCQKSSKLSYEIGNKSKVPSLKYRKNIYKENINSKEKNSSTDKFIKKLFSDRLNKNDQPFEIKCTHRYELFQKNYSLKQLVRMRALEGFYLIKITKDFVKNLSTPKKQNNQEDIKHSNYYVLITLYFMRHFTQTIIFIYKISYYALCTNENQNTLLDSNSIDKDLEHANNSILKTNENSTENNQNETGKSKIMDITSLNKMNQKLLKQKEIILNKYMVEIWLSWNFLHLKSNYQNSLIEKVKQALASIIKADTDRVFTLTQDMLNPPEILKLKEPLFKISNENKVIYDNHENRNNTVIIPMENLNYELNIRGNKSTEYEIIEYAKSWWHLAFFKHNKVGLDKCFSYKTIKLILDFDKPLPDINTVLFDMKNTSVQMGLDFLSAHRKNYLEKNTRNISNLHNYENDEYFLNEQINGLQNLGYSNTSNQNKRINSVFTCQNSMNKLCVALTDWCDIMLVENCVYLKYLIPSPKYITSFDKIEDSLIQISKNHSTTQIKGQALGSKNNLNDLDLTDSDNSNLKNQTINSNSTEFNNTNQIKNTANITHDHSYQNEESNQSKLPNYSSFVIIKLDSQNTPYVSLDFVFHSEISYLDQILLIEKFKEKLNVLKFSISPSRQPVSNSSKIVINSNTQPNATNINFNDSNFSIDEDFTQKKLDKLNEYYESFQIIYKQNLYNTFKSVLLDLDTSNEIQTQKIEPRYNSNKFENILNESEYFTSFSILNFMIQRKYKWIINKNFSIQTSLSLKEIIIDTFIRIRLKEGFTCLFKSKNFIVLSFQIPMIDSGEINNNQYKNKDSKPGQKNSEQICSFIYIIRFFNSFNLDYLMRINYKYQKEINTPYDTSSNNTSNTNKKQSTSSNNVHLNIISQNSNNNNNVYCDYKSNIDNDYDREQAKEKIMIEKNYEEIFFSTELYIEAIDGINQKKKTNSFPNNLKKTREKDQSIDYFKNLTNLEIANLIYMIDFKTFQTLQSSYALFLSKSNPYSNLDSLMNSKKNQESFLKNIDADSSSYETIFNISNYNPSFLEAIRILPDLNLLPKQKFLKCTNELEPEHLKLTQEPIRFIRPPKSDVKIKTHVNKLNQKNQNEQSVKAQTVKKKKNEVFQLCEQIKPVLNVINFKNSNNEEFKFTLRNILLESSLYVCLFEDIPFNLFGNANNSKNKSNNCETDSIKKIEELFFDFIDEEFKTYEDKISSPPKFSLDKSTDKFNNCEKIVDEMKNEVKNLIIVKLADLKCGNTITKQIIDDLKYQNNSLDKKDKNNQDDSEIQEKSKNFHLYFKFNISNTTSKEANDSKKQVNENLSSNKSASLNIPIKKNNLLDHNENQANSFYVYGFFFLKSVNQSQTQNNNSYKHIPNASNKLVFFIFNSIPDNIKYSLVDSHSNTFVIKKFLFSSSKLTPKNNDINFVNKSSFNDNYRFYCNKKANDLRKANTESNKSTNSTFNSSIANTTNLIKKYFTISDILKIHLAIGNNNSNFLNYIDYIEEKFAKFYIKSVIHYIGLYSARYDDYFPPTSHDDDTIHEANSLNQRKILEVEPVKQLLKIGQKIKLIDLDLTDYLKISCLHLKNKDSENDKSDKKQHLDKLVFDQKKCQVSNSNINIFEYLENKFDEIFLKNFNLLPGFEDLLIFMPLKNVDIHNENQEKNSNKDSMAVNINTFNSRLKDSHSFENDNLYEEEIDFILNDNNKNIYDLDENSDTFDSYDDNNIYSDSDDDESYDDISYKENSELKKNLILDEYDNSHFEENKEFKSYQNESNFDLDARKYSIDKLSLEKKKKKIKRIKVSSPDLTTNKFSFDKISNDKSSLRSSEMNDQIIGLEYVTVFGSEFNYDENTRTQTKLIDNKNENIENIIEEQENEKSEKYEQIEENDNKIYNDEKILKQQESIDKNIYSNRTQINNEIQGKTHTRNFIFYSKFSKFNISCLMDLIEEKDKEEFDKLIDNFIINSKFNSNDPKVLISKNVKIYLRFNWYSFDDANLTNPNMFYSKNSNLLNSASNLVNSDQNQLINQIFTNKPNSNMISINNLVGPINLLLNQQQFNVLNSQPSNNLIIPNRTNSLHQSFYQKNYNFSLNKTITNSSKTSYNSNFQINKVFKGCQKFEYNHLLCPRIKEFRWHLKDKIFQNQDIKLKNKGAFRGLMMHIKDGVKRNFNHCHYETKKIILNKTTITYITSIVDAKPMTNAARLHSSKTTTTKSIEEDKSILSVDSNKFFSEFLEMIKTLENSFYNCKIQQINHSFCLNCNYHDSILSESSKEFSLKILIDLLKKQTKTFNHDNTNKSKNLENNSTSPTIISSNSSYQKSLNQNKTLENKRKTSLSYSSNQTAEPNSSYSCQSNPQNSRISQQSAFQRQVSQKQQPQIKQEIIINQIKVKSYFEFNNSDMNKQENQNQKLIEEFNNKLDDLIKLVYLKLILKEIDISKKWNNLLYLNENYYNFDDKNSFLIKNDEEYMNDNSSINDSKITIKNEQNKLICNCVWSVCFKLHRLHQIMQKVHGNEQIQISQSNSSQQQYVSQGLKKLQEVLFNFRIYDSNCGDLYIYTHKNEIYILKLEEIYDNQTNFQNQSQIQINNSSVNQNLNLDGSVVMNDSSIDINDKSISSSLFKNQQSSQNTKMNILSRRPSYASIADSELLQQMKSNNGKSQNLSGGSVNTVTASMVTGNLGLQSIGFSSLNSHKSNPEYIKLNVYGLQPPDKEMKEELCKTLQSQLDLSLLIKMCNSIDKNTYKTSSAQHPDRITEEDLTFFKQICDNYFDYELPLPFIFNFNRTMRENFFYFIKQIFNSSFKAIDSPINQFNMISGVTQVKKTEKPAKVDSLSMSSKSNEHSGQQFEGDNEYEELNNLITQNYQSLGQINNYFPTNTTQKVSSAFNQQLSFSYMSTKPSLGPYENNMTYSSNLYLNKPKPEYNPFLIQLTRIFFQNPKTRIGKQVHVSLVLVEAYYAIKGLDYLVSSKIARSNSMGTNNDLSNNNSELLFTSSKNQMNSNQFLETSITPSKQAGPTFLFRFYCKGENDTISYKESLKNGLNNALLYFLSDYLTKIEPELYLKSIVLKKNPAIFRISNNEKNSLGLLIDDDKIKNRKRHKSMGSERIIEKSLMDKSETSSFLLKMNKSARETRLGKLLVNQNITNENDLNIFIINNFSNNLFDHRDYTDTIEYFRESIKSFEYSKIFNNLINQSYNLSNFSIDFDESYFYDFYEDTSVLRKDHRSLSIDQTSNLETNLERNSITLNDVEIDTLKESVPDSKNLLKSKNDLSNYNSHQKTYLRIIYEWLKGLYLVQLKNNSNLRLSNKMGSNQTLSSSLNLSNKPVNTPLASSSSTNVSSSSSSNSILNQSVHSPIATASSVLNSLSNQSTTPMYIIRKKINYLTKYNLTSLIREIELGLRETSKCELTVNYFSFRPEPKATKLRNVDKKDIIKSKNFKKSGTTTEDILSSSLNDNVFVEEKKSNKTNLDSYQKTELKSCLRNKTNKIFRQYSESDTNLNTQANSFYILDECNFGKDFDDLKQTTFLRLHECLSNSENLIITMNIEHSLTNSSTSYNMNTTLSSSSSNNYQNNSTVNYSRIPSFTGSTNSSLASKDHHSGSAKTSSTINLTNSTNSTTSSNSSNSTSTIVNVSTDKNLQQPSTNNNNTSIMIKSMSSNSGELDSSLSLSNSLALLSLQLKRTYLYAIVHCKNKTITFYCFTTESSNYDSIKLILEQISENITQRYHLVNNTVLYKFGGLIGENLIYDLKRVKILTVAATCQYQSLPNAENLQEKIDSQLSFNNDSHKLINVKNHNVSTSSFNNQKLSKTSSVNLFNSTTSSSTNQVNSQPLNTFLAKSLSINQYNNKSYDSIIHIINQQINFCSHYFNNSNLSEQTSIHNLSFKPQTTITNQIKLNSSNQHLIHSSISSLLGVGLSYQLFEMQQIYRHPKKIYDIAFSLSNNQSPNILNSQIISKISQPSTPKQNYSKLNLISNSSASSSIVVSQQQNKSQLSVSDFYKNYILPVLVPYHYCCTPLLFYPSWNDTIVIENSLKNNISNANLQSNKPELFKTHSISNTNTLSSNDSWFYKMRQRVLSEYSEYFESRGFIRLKDDRNIFDSNPKQSLNQVNQNNHILLTENQVHHFIKWIQQDGFLYITLNLDEVFLHVKIGYSSRYRASSISFLNEIIKFFNLDFHVHSLIYDFHLSAINKNFLPGGLQISSTSHLIAKFLNEFVDFFSRTPYYSSNKIFKLIHEKCDSSLIPHQFRLIFDFIIDSKKHVSEQNEQPFLSFKTLYVFDNNIAIYSLNDNKNSSSDYSKFLVVKIENYCKNKTTPTTPNNSIIAPSVNSTNSSRKQSNQPKSNEVFQVSTKITKTIAANESAINLSKLSDSSSSISLMNTSSIYDSGSTKPLHQSYLEQHQNQTEPFIRTICFYLCINKNHILSKRNDQPLRFNDDLNYINKVIERSINLYKQDIFWDNLTLSMSSFKNILNENINIGLNNAIFFKVNSQELEQILAISHKINILEIDSNLTSFLSQCYSIRDKIKTYLEFSFGRHFIFTSSESVEYCLLLINDDLIKNFRHSESSALSPVSGITLNNENVNFSYQNTTSNDSSNQQLSSFVLLKFDKLSEIAQILHINRIKTVNNFQNFSNTLNLGSMQDPITLVKRSATIDSSMTISSNKNIELSYKYENNLTSNKYLCFTVNTLLYILWESLFSNS